MSERVLCVDDDTSILQAYERGLRKQFAIETATGAEEGLAAIAARGPYAVVVSDMQMPGMDGIQFLARVKEQAPATVRIMLTGRSDQQTAIEAVNEGNIFRFLSKPCPAEQLAKALRAGIEQYRLINAEKELLEKTLSGSIKVLTDVLSLVNPAAFGRASRVRRIARRLAEQMKAEKAWAIDLAAMLSQIGCVTLPPETLEKLYHGRPLTDEECEMFHSHPSVGRGLVGNIPRLEAVAEIIAYQEKRFDGGGVPADSRRGTDIPLGARILKVALDFDAAKSANLSELEAVVRLRQREGWYDPGVLSALEAVSGVEETYEIREVMLRELSSHMILADDIRTTGGVLLVCKGQEATPYLRQRLNNYSKHARVREPIRVLVRPERAPEPAGRPA